MVRRILAVCMAAMMFSAGDASACIVPQEYPVEIAYCAPADPTTADGLLRICPRASYDIERCSKLVEEGRTSEVALLARFHLARAYAYIEHRGALELGMRDLDEAFRLGTDSPEAHHLRGVVYAASGEYRLALAAFEAAALSYSTHPLAKNRRAVANLNARGDVQEALGLFADAATSFTEAVRLVEADRFLPGYGSDLLLLRRGVASIKAGDSDSGERDIAVALRTLNPTMACYERARHGLLDGAFRDCRQAIDIATVKADSRAMAEALAVRGWVQVKAGNLQLALEDFEAALSSAERWWGPPSKALFGECIVKAWLKHPGEPRSFDRYEADCKRNWAGSYAYHRRSRSAFGLLPGYALQQEYWEFLQ